RVDRQACILRSNIIRAHLKTAKGRSDIYALILLVFPIFLNVDVAYRRLYVNILAVVGLVCLHAASRKQNRTHNQQNTGLYKTIRKSHSSSYWALPVAFAAAASAGLGHGRENPRWAIPGSVTGNLPRNCNSPNSTFTALSSELGALE